MTHSTITMLDQDELFQLACNASSVDDSAAAIAYLKEAVSRPDATARAHYLLGAEYAQIKLYERAAEAMQSALALDPALAIARLQLGLLWLGHGDTERAQSMLAPLDDLPASHPLHQFGAGLRHLIHDRFDEAVLHLERGIALNGENAPLNSDMRHILEELARVRRGAAAPPEAGSAGQAASPEEVQHILLSAYTGNTSH